MSAIGAWLDKLFGAVGGAPATVALVVVGVVVGGLVGVGAGGAFNQPAPSSGLLPIYPCPKVGPALAQVPSGQHMLVTGRSADSAWLRIHYAAPGPTEAWVPAAAIKLPTAIADLPVGDCSPEVALGFAASPGPTLTVVGSFEPTPSPTPSPTPPPTPPPTPRPTSRPTPTPTPVDTTPPRLANLKANPPRFTNRECTKRSQQSIVTITASDPESEVRSVKLTVVNNPQYPNFSMTKFMRHVSGSTWRITLDSVRDGIPIGLFEMTAEGTNGAGLKRVSGSPGFTVYRC